MQYIFRYAHINYLDINYQHHRTSYFQTRTRRLTWSLAQQLTSLTGAVWGRGAAAAR